MKERSQESEKLIEWAYREWADYKLAKAGEALDDAPVWLGVNATVPVAAKSDVVVTLPRRSRQGLKVSVVYDHAAAAPVQEGQTIGKLLVTAPDTPELDVPLVAMKEVDRVGAFTRAGLTAGYLIFGRKN
jgi:serine-type D-Ala-D-Ala carboxypeptidase (penicillin-binding protein 5/6)